MGPSSKCNEDCYVDIIETDIESKYLGLLRILLRDRTTGRNIIWACDEYRKHGEQYTADHEITIKQITGKNTKLIRPRIAKSREECRTRTRKSAEVFTPSWICAEMLNYCDEQWFERTDVFNFLTGKTWIQNPDKIPFQNTSDWQRYVDSRRLEITCGEGPYLTSRYDTTSGDYIPVERRIGILDRKLRVVDENTTDESEWLKWVIRAYCATYGYEYQGDNLLLARENLVWTFIDNYKCRFNKDPDLDILKTIARIISWNIWQMDGLTTCVPCFGDERCRIQLSLFGGLIPDEGQPHLCQIKNWRSKTIHNFQDLKGAKSMKFDFCIGNPPYQGDNHQQLYPAFYISGQDIADVVELIFPIGWQAPKNANNLRILNNAKIKEDKQIIFINNKHNVFQDVTGAEWTNIIMWKKGYDNNLNGKQRILTEGTNEKHITLIYDNSKLEKPSEIITLFELIKEHDHFESIASITSARKPYGLSTDIISNTSKYGLEALRDTKNSPDDIKIYCKGDIIKYANNDYRLPRISPAKDKYKVFVPYAWGNMSEKTGLGGAYSNIIIASPNEICSESYLESGSFDNFETAQKHAKYLMTKFLRALLYLNKYSQHSTTAWDAIPLQDYNESWWSKSIAEIDIELMKKYKAPNKVIDFIFNNIQTKNETNIINYK